MVERRGRPSRGHLLACVELVCLENPAGAAERQGAHRDLPAGQERGADAERRGAHAHAGAAHGALCPRRARGRGGQPGVAMFVSSGIEN